MRRGRDELGVCCLVLSGWFTLARSTDLKAYVAIVIPRGPDGSTGRNQAIKIQLRAVVVHPSSRQGAAGGEARGGRGRGLDGVLTGDGQGRSRGPVRIWGRAPVAIQAAGDECAFLLVLMHGAEGILDEERRVQPVALRALGVGDIEKAFERHGSGHKRRHFHGRHRVVNGQRPRRVECLRQPCSTRRLDHLEGERLVEGRDPSGWRAVRRAAQGQGQGLRA